MSTCIYASGQTSIAVTGAMLFLTRINLVRVRHYEIFYDIINNYGPVTIYTVSEGNIRILTTMSQT